MLLSKSISGPDDTNVAILAVLSYLYSVTSAVQIFEIWDRIEKIISIRFDLKPIRLGTVFEYLYIYKEGTVSQ